ncbi:MCM10 homolog [Paramuricea clavata]|uniref:MCM10 homolog n=1 Tax=Paramuricea clavata TaxID=317549 RepID=A0A7D9L0V4_PARCT|nr:MCM10 homolog [Paramuricea clavata]
MSTERLQTRVTQSLRLPYLHVNRPFLCCRYGAPSKLPGSNLKQKVAGESFFYGGKIVSSSPAAPPRKEKVTLKSLAAPSSGGKDYLNAWKEKQSEKNTSGESSGNKDGPSDDFIGLLNVPTVGSRNLKLHLHKEDEKEKEVNEPKPVLSASEFLKANNVQRKKERQSTSSVSKTRTKSSTESTTSKDSPTPKTPVLGRGLNFDDDVVFDENVPLNFARNSSSNPDKAKKLALAIVRKTGPITPKDPNNVRVKKPSPKLQDVIKSKLESDDESGL